MPFGEQGLVLWPVPCCRLISPHACCILLCCLWIAATDSYCCYSKGNFWKQWQSGNGQFTWTRATFHWGEKHVCFLWTSNKCPSVCVSSVCVIQISERPHTWWHPTTHVHCCAVRHLDTFPMTPKRAGPASLSEYNWQFLKRLWREFVSQHHPAVRIGG